jgi:hypothetical protein
MPRLFYGNFDFEESLANSRRGQRKQTTKRLLAELACAWIAVAEDGDRIWSPVPIEARFTEDLREAGWPAFRIVSDPDEVPRASKFVPWGWTDESLAFGESLGATFHAPPLKSVRRVNSRQFSFELAQTFEDLLPGRAVARSTDELSDAVERLLEAGNRALVKTEFSHAGRNRWIADPGLRRCGHSLQRWATSRIADGQRLYVEPWLNAVAEAGLQFEILPSGQITFVGTAEMICGPHGTYAGSLVTASSDSLHRWTEAIEIGRSVCRAAADEGYFGPLGVDAMWYRQADGRIALRSVQEINARWTMGRLSLGLRRWFRPNEQGRWLFGAAARADLASAAPPGSRRIPTSPPLIGGLPLKLQSLLVVENRSAVSFHAPG